MKKNVTDRMRTAVHAQIYSEKGRPCTMHFIQENLYYALYIHLTTYIIINCTLNW